MAESKGYTELLSRRKRGKLQLQARLEEEIRQLEDEMSSVGITESNIEPLFSEIREARKNLDIPEFREVQELSEELLSYGHCLEADPVSKIEEITHPEWLLPTSTLSKSDFSSWEEFHSGQLQVESIDSFWLEILVNGRVKETLLNWEQEPLIENRYLILKQGVEAHLNQLFYLSVSTLLPQVEGLLREILETKTKGKGYDFNSLAYNEMRDATLTLTNTWKSDAPNMLKGTVAMLDWLPSTVADLYHEYKPEKAIAGKLYRHGICHGLQLDFGSEKNSLRLILIIDRIVSFYTSFDTNP